MENKLAELELGAIIEIIERPENQGTEYQQKAKDELLNRQSPAEEIRQLAIGINETIAYQRLMNDDVASEEVELHHSNYLSEEEVRQIYIDQLEQYMKRKDGFRFDVWSYAIGGI